jgi:hypothetical protein
MDTMKPRLIRADNGIIDASEIAYVEEIEPFSSSNTYAYDSFRFYVGSGTRVFLFTSKNRNNLEEIRRRLIKFVWPNADVFDPSKNNAAS